jgi:hypothetical protein
MCIIVGIGVILCMSARMHTPQFDIIPEPRSNAMQMEGSVYFVLLAAVGSDCDQGAGLISDPNPMQGLGKIPYPACMSCGRLSGGLWLARYGFRAFV